MLVCRNVTHGGCDIFVFQKLQVKLDVTLVSILKQSYTFKPQLVQHSSQFDIVYIWISKFIAIIAKIY